jgi:hypothetical protein
MPDGRVWTAGGNSPNQPGQPPTPVQKQIEIYEPPYPAGPQPKITSCPSSTRYNSQFTVGVPKVAIIACMVLMRCGPSTHAFDADQRAVLLRFQTAGTNALVATAPPSGTVAPPGPYRLFVVDDVGRPCEYAKFIQSAANGNSAITRGRLAKAMTPPTRTVALQLKPDDVSKVTITLPMPLSFQLPVMRGMV